ncbi:hypothetical protein N7447_003474 [Penicillium robsamsonii]|uniref:uncharacterized protein n=1 Tax=Penicillium robsamsonii TaxID=1792511 RepID=UPI002546856F|nr:uncharacterized protein N7447_003474 [Penicillium robsamsonii]KAJ5826711.1 hypothetical protein N7447_003474 [Penicillium robsamsonii]
MGQIKLTHDDYTVGWVCVLECELNASRALLDEEHERLPAAEKDDNAYLLGKMGGHNVIIAFPAVYGVGAAAQTATNMIRTFRNLRFGLMVGIGGAAPNPARFGRPGEDMRLGDVVVSEPKGDEGGVVHYDLGQRKADGKLHKRSHLNKPPMFLLTAMKLLRSDHPFGRGEMNRYIARIGQLSETSEIFEAYQHPGRDNDRLYRVDYDHEDGEEDCTRCDTNSTETRAPRKSDAPVVHYGLIASGNAVIKDPRYRDELRKAWNVACFEMEAAGLMDNFPCLVIRGISDYSDTHKNDIWQPYAAVTAAAYAKDLLRVILPQEIHAAKVVEMKEVMDVLSNIQTGVSIINSSISTTQEHELLVWLSPKDYGSEQTDILRQRQEGTGTWLLETLGFETWVAERNKTIYCRGMPGAGKTVMTAVVVDGLRSRFEVNPAVGIACIYCSVQNEAEQTHNSIFLSLLRQLVRQLSYTPEMVKSMYDRHQRTGSRPSFREIVEVLQDTVARFERTFIVFDALDELLTSESPPKQLVRELFAFQGRTGINIFATSRFVPEIAGEFKDSILIDIRAAEGDVVQYLGSHIGELPAFVSETPGLEDEIKTGIIEAIDGMFLLAKLHLISLMDKISIRDIKDTLKTLPRGFDGYDKSYLEAMNNIYGQRQGLRELALKVLSWICCSRRLLLATELQHALAVKEKHTEFDILSIPDIGLLVSVCKGLVIVDGERGTIRLVHYTTQQYFERTWQEWFHDAHERIAETTLRYLTFTSFDSGACATGTEFKARLDQYALYDYASRNWGYHVRDALFEETSLVLKLLEHEKCVSSAAQAMFAERSQVRSERSPHGMTGLHVAAYFGLEKTARLLLRKFQPDVKDSSGRTPLHWASARGHAAVVVALLENNLVDADRQDDEGQTPLFLAAYNGHGEIVDLLMGRGVEFNHMDHEKQTPLCAAAHNGDRAVIKAFLLHQVDIDFENGHGETPLVSAAGQGHAGSVELLLTHSAPLVPRTGNRALSRAASNGYAAVVKLLLQYGTDADHRDEDGRTPLFSAAQYGHEEVVSLFLGHQKVNPNAENIRGQTPLSVAAWEGHENAVRLLLADSRVNPDHKDRKGQTPLSLAAFWIRTSVVELLLEVPRVDANSMNSSGQTPLSLATQNGGAEVVERLLQTSIVDPDLREQGSGNTPLAVAAQYGRDFVVKLLLATPGVDPNSTNAKGETPLSLAAREGHAYVIELLLLDGRADCNHRNETGRTSLSWASGRGHTTTVESLLTVHTVDVNAPDDEGRTPLLWAAWGGYPTIVNQLLATRKVDLECRDSNGQTPLSRAAESGGLTAVEILLEEGADANAEDKDGMTPLMRSVENGHVQVAEALLTAGASPGGVDQEGRTPLLIAVEAGRREVVELLLNDAGLDPDASGEYGYTPLELAEECGWDDIVDLIEAAHERRTRSTGSDLPPQMSSWASPFASAMGLSNSNPGWDRGKRAQGVVSHRGGTTESTAPEVAMVNRSYSQISLDE